MDKIILHCKPQQQPHVQDTNQSQQDYNRNKDNEMKNNELPTQTNINYVKVKYIYLSMSRSKLIMVDVFTRLPKKDHHRAEDEKTHLTLNFVSATYF